MRSSDPFWIKPCSLACFRGKKKSILAYYRKWKNFISRPCESFSRDSLRARITRSNPQIFIHRFSVVLHLSVSLWIAKNYARIVGVRKDGQPGIRSSLWNPEIVKHDIRRILIGVGINSLSPPLPSPPSPLYPCYYEPPENLISIPESCANTLTRWISANSWGSKQI